MMYDAEDSVDAVLAGGDPQSPIYLAAKASVEEKVRKYRMSKELADLVQASKNIVVLTGAGMSTESGIPDFRSGDGLWKGKGFAQLATTAATQNNFREQAEFYAWRIENVLDNKPNQGHEILAKWEQDGRVSCIVTQNVDGYHQKAGSKVVHEVHGNLLTVYCNSCGESADSSEFLAKVFYCPSCGGKRRPNIVMFGEVLPDKPAHAAEQAAMKCDLFIVIGTSLNVYPAAHWPQYARSAGAKVVIINKDSTANDRVAHLIVRGGIGETLAQVDRILSR